MIPLIRKDLFIIRKAYALTAVFTVAISVLCLYWGVDAGGVFIFSALLAFILMGYGSLVSDQEEASTCFLLTLPVSKNVFVLSKYMSGIAVGVAIWATTFVILLLVHFMPATAAEITFADLYAGLIWSVSLNVLFFTFLIPAYHLLGYKGTRFLIVIPILGASFSSQIVHSPFAARQYDKWTAHISSESLLLLFLVVCLIVYLFSYFVSLLIVKRKAY